MAQFEHTVDRNGVADQGTSSQRPANAYDGKVFYDKTLRQLIAWDAQIASWFAADGKLLYSASNPRMLSDDFRGSTLDTRYSVAKGSNGSAALPVLTAGDYLGELVLTTGAAGDTVAHDGCEITGPGLDYSPASPPSRVPLISVQTSVKLGSVTNAAAFFGLTDALAATTLEMPLTLATGITVAGDTLSATSLWSIKGTGPAVLYWAYTAPGSFPGTGTVSVYSDSAGANLVAQGTGTVPATTGSIAITLAARNSSGITGTVTVAHDAASVAQASTVKLTLADTFTAAATNAVGLVFDTGASHLTWRACGVNAGTVDTGVETGIAPVASTYATLRITVDATGLAKFYVNGTLVATIAAAVAPAATLTPVIAATARTTASLVVTADYLVAK